MKHIYLKDTGYASFKSQNARNQAKLAIVLMAVIPALSLFYIGTVIGRDSEQFTLYTKIIIFTLTASTAVSGYLILRKYPENILKLRRYVSEIVQGTLPDRVDLIDSRGSDDIRFIENSFNSILEEMRNRIKVAEEKLRIEHQLKGTIEQRQQVLLNAERNRVMIQSLGAACHHLDQPITTLKMHLYIMRGLVTTSEELEANKDCTKTIEEIVSIFEKLHDVNAFSTESYVRGTYAVDDDEILKIA